MDTEGKDCLRAMPATTGERRIAAGEHGEDSPDSDDPATARQAPVIAEFAIDAERRHRRAVLLRFPPMKHASWKAPGLWALLALLLAACAGPPAQKSAAPVASSSSRNPDEVAANALNMWASGSSTQALAQMQKATQLAPERPEFLWLSLRLCMEVKGCEAEPIEAQLRKLDPSSGAVWLGPLARAQARRDTAAAEQILEVMSRAAHFNVYWTSLIARLTPPISRMPTAASNAAAPTPLTNGLNTTVGWLSRLNVRAFTPVSTACDKQRVREPATRVRCELISQALQRSDTTLVEGLGLGIAQHLVAPDSAAYMQLLERINTLRYQNQASGSVVASQVEREKFSQEMLQLMTQLPREQDVSKAILRWAGQPLSPTAMR